MTHDLLWFVPDIVLVGTTLAIISLGPGLGLASIVYRRNRLLGCVAGAVVGTVWAKATLLWKEHAARQRAIAERTDCTGYGSMMPERCVEAITSPTAMPSGFTEWSTAALAIGVLGLVVVWADQQEWGAVQ